MQIPWLKSQGFLLYLHSTSKANVDRILSEKSLFINICKLIVYDF